MRLWTFFKFCAALCVMGIMALTGMLAYHITVKPLGGIFSEIVPDPVRIGGGHSDDELAKMLESPDMPDIDPGEKTFQKAHELLAMGKVSEAHEKLLTIINVFPNSPTAPTARRIVGEINLDEVLSTSHMDGKQIHLVKRGDSLLGVAARYKTTIDCIMHLNSMMELPRLQPGQELVVMPLEFRLLIESRRNSVSLWQGGKFMRDYQVMQMPNKLLPQRTVISSKTAEIEGRRILPETKEYRSAQKIITLEKPILQIRSWNSAEEKPAGSIILAPADMEEIALLTRVSNEVEIR